MKNLKIINFKPSQIIVNEAVKKYYASIEKWKLS
jgi:hypothetical protein